MIATVPWTKGGTSNSMPKEHVGKQKESARIDTLFLDAQNIYLFTTCTLRPPFTFRMYTPSG